MWLQLVSYHDPKLNANEHRELTAHVCNLHLQQPEHVEIEVMQGTLKEANLQVCITTDSCSLQTLPLLGI